MTPSLFDPSEAAYRDRTDAGRRLAGSLAHLARAHPLVLAIPHGGVEVARPVADALGAPLDLILVRKLPVPFSPETAFGVIAEDGTTSLDDELVARLGLTEDAVAVVRSNVLATLRRYARAFESVRPRFPVRGATVVLVDDGLATGYTMLGAVRLCRAGKPDRIVVATPVASKAAATMVQGEADEFICPLVDAAFPAVGAYYAHFPSLTDEDVRRALFAQAPDHRPAGVTAEVSP